jgi:hypothetical protein
MAYDWTAQLEDAIIEGLTERNLTRLCMERKDIPSRWTILRRMDDSPAFATRCARADKLRGQLWATKVELEAESCDPVTAQAAKVKISAYQWLASKEDAKYGDKLTTELSGPNGGAIPVSIEIDL